MQGHSPSRASSSCSRYPIPRQTRPSWRCSRAGMRVAAMNLLATRRFSSLANGVLKMERAGCLGSLRFGPPRRSGSAMERGVWARMCRRRSRRGRSDLGADRECCACRHECVWCVGEAENVRKDACSFRVQDRQARTQDFDGTWMVGQRVVGGLCVRGWLQLQLRRTPGYTVGRRGTQTKSGPAPHKCSMVTCHCPLS